MAEGHGTAGALMDRPAAAVGATVSHHVDPARIRGQADGREKDRTSETAPVAVWVPIAAPDGSAKLNRPSGRLAAMRLETPGKQP